MSTLWPSDSYPPKHSLSLFRHSQSDSEQLDISASAAPSNLTFKLSNSHSTLSPSAQEHSLDSTRPNFGHSTLSPGIGPQRALPNKYTGTRLDSDSKLRRLPLRVDSAKLRPLRPVTRHRPRSTPSPTLDSTQTPSGTLPPPISKYASISKYFEVL